MKERTFFCLILAFMIVLASNIQQAQSDTLQLKYGDNSAEAFYSPWSSEEGSEVALRFSPPAGYVRLDMVKFYIPYYRAPGSGFRVKVYAVGPDGKPGNRLDRGDPDEGAEVGVGPFHAPTGDAWIKVKLMNYEIPLPNGDFFVSMYWINAPGEQGSKAQTIGLDTDSEAADSFVKFGKSGEWTSANDAKLKGVPMIRAVISDEEIPVVSVTAAVATTTSPSEPGVFEITRTGDLKKALVVYYSLDASTAVKGKDYKKIGGKVKIRAKQASATVSIIPLSDPVVETKSVVLEVKDSNKKCYLPDEAANTAEVVLQGAN